MVEYFCNLCDKIFYRKSIYDKHKLKKIPCNKYIINPFLSENNPEKSPKIPKNTSKNDNDLLDISSNMASNNIKENKNICEYCNKNFTLKCHLTRHIKFNCKVYKNVKEKEYNNNILEELLKKQTETNEILKIYETKFKELDNKLKKYNNDNIISNKKKVNKKKYVENTNSNNIINNNSNNIINNINICSLGSEDISKLSSKVLRSMYVCDNDKLFLNSIEGINFNPDLPQNHNISYRNLRSNDCQVYDDNKWSTMDIKEVIKMLISSHSYYLKRIILENNNLKLSKYIKDNILLELIKYNRTIVKQDEIDRVMEDLNITVLDDIDVCHEKIYNSFKRLLYDKTKELNIKSK